MGAIVAKNVKRGDANIKVLEFYVKNYSKFNSSNNLKNK